MILAALNDDSFSCEQFTTAVYYLHYIYSICLETKVDVYLSVRSSAGYNTSLIYFLSCSIIHIHCSRFISLVKESYLELTKVWIWINPDFIGNSTRYFKVSRSTNASVSISVYYPVSTKLINSQRPQ